MLVLAGACSALLYRFVPHAPWVGDTPCTVSVGIYSWQEVLKVVLKVVSSL